MIAEAIKRGTITPEMARKISAGETKPAASTPVKKSS